MTENILILPPRPGACRVCAARHAEGRPHELGSLYYQVMFYRRNRRFPTWEDAMRHCSEEVKAAFREELSGRAKDP